jgi:hypothetical protein
MNIWLIDIIRSANLVCNVLFFVLTWIAAGLISKGRKAEITPLMIGIWIVCLVGVIFIPSKETLKVIFG